MSEHFGDDDWERILLEPFNYLVSQTSGKNFRITIMKALNHWYKISDDKFDIIANFINLLHTSTLIIDDIEDNSDMRRGIPASHMIFGTIFTLKSCNFIYFRALKKLVKEFPREKLNSAISIFNKWMLKCHLGQGMDIYYRDNFICPKEQEYLNVARGKTGALMQMMSNLMQLFSEIQYDFTDLLDCVAEYYQVRDDYGNLKMDWYINIKGFAEDLTEGKFSYPIIHAIKTNPNDRTIIHILKQRTTDNNMKRIAIKKMEELGSLNFTLKKMKQLDETMVQLIGSFDFNPEFDKIFSLLRNLEC